jgi:hypothetical protein
LRSHELETVRLEPSADGAHASQLLAPADKLLGALLDLLDRVHVLSYAASRSSA